MAVNCVISKRCLSSFSVFCYKSMNIYHRICYCGSVFISQASYSKGKYSVELEPNIEELLQSGEVKHRKHAGIRQITPISLPDPLKSAAEKIVSEENETFFVEEAKRLCKHLAHRRLPVEKSEIIDKIFSVTPEFDGDFENLTKTANKEQLKEIKKRINLEMGRWKPILYNYHTSLSYLVGRLAPNYASAYFLFDELKKKVPDFKPESYFDFGSGVGSSLWAAHTHWSDSIKEYFCIDTSADMIDLCGNLISEEHSEEKLIKPVFFRQFLPVSQTAKYDLVVSAFSLLELPNGEDRLKVIDTLWRKTKQFLVIVEYGTVAGFHCVLDARDFIIKVENDSSPEYAAYSSGAHVISPCPHDSVCPKFAEKLNSTCGFTVPYYVQFPRKHSKAIRKDWISYVILRKCPRPEDYETFPRIVKPVMKIPKRVICHLCHPDGQLKDIIFSRKRHGRHIYRCARVSNMGDVLPFQIKPGDIPDDPE